MFETSQEESNSGMGKTVGGVIAVVAVLLVVVWFVYLRGQPGATTAGGKGAATKAAASGEKPDPIKDLSIVKFDLRRDPATQTMAMWNIQVANRSRGYAYKDIHYSTNYYNGQDAVIGHNEGTLKDPVDPADQHTFSEINDGLYPMGTVRYTIEIKGAQPVAQ